VRAKYNTIGILWVSSVNIFYITANWVAGVASTYVVSWGGVRLSPLGTSATIWPVVPVPDDRWWWVWSSRWIDNWQGKPKYSKKACSNATLSTINPTWPDLGSNPGRRGGKPATNRLSYGTAFDLCNFTHSVRKYDIYHRELWNDSGWSPLLCYSLFYFLHIASSSLIEVLITVFTLCFIYLTACYIITNHIVISVLVRQFINCLL
jgi:hypothetical protein